MIYRLEWTFWDTWTGYRDRIWAASSRGLLEQGALMLVLVVPDIWIRYISMFIRWGSLLVHHLG